MTTVTASPLKHTTCIVCSQALEVEDHVPVTCPRCGHCEVRWTWRSSHLCFIFALTAAILYLPANFLPFMTIEMYGSQNSSTIWQGIMSLMDQRTYAIALIVFLASILIPAVKLLILLYLTATAHSDSQAKFKMHLYHFVEAIGRWSMLDIFLLAVLVAMVKLGHIASVRVEFGAVLFLLVVIFTMLASAYFDPRVLWKGPHDNSP